MSLWARFRRAVRARASGAANAPLPVGTRALVVAAHPFLGSMIARVLEEGGYSVATARGTQDAVEVASLHSPGLVVYAPRDATAEDDAAIRKASGAAALVLVVPAQVSNAELVSTIAATGAVAWLGAPFREEDLLEAAREALSTAPEDLARRERRKAELARS